MAKKEPWIKEEGKLTKIFSDAGIDIGDGIIKDPSVMNAKNCDIVADYMLKNVKKWNEKGKNPKQEGRGMFAVHLRRKEVNQARKDRITRCQNKVVKALSELPPTPRK